MECIRCGELRWQIKAGYRKMIKREKNANGNKKCALPVAAEFQIALKIIYKITYSIVTLFTYRLLQQTFNSCNV